jgi:hypothetical protein
LLKKKAAVLSREEQETPLCCCVTPEPAGGWLMSGRQWLLRNILRRPVFEGTILLMIVWSSLMLAFEDYKLRENKPLADVLDKLNLFFAVVFAVEAAMKIVGYGWKCYFRLGRWLVSAKLASIYL